MGLVAQAALVLAVGIGGWQEGYAVRYAVGKMQRVAAVRGITAQGCMVAWTAATDDDIGETVLRVRGPTGRELRCLVVDLPQPGRDKANLVRRKVLIELDYESSDICPRGWQGKARECKVRVKVDD